MTEKLMGIFTILLRGNKIYEVHHASDCMGDTYIITFTNSFYELHIQYNDDKECWLEIVRENTFKKPDEQRYIDIASTRENINGEYNRYYLEDCAKHKLAWIKGDK